MALSKQGGGGPDDLLRCLPTSSIQGFPHPLVALGRDEVEELKRNEVEPWEKRVLVGERCFSFSPCFSVSFFIFSWQ